MRKSSGVHWRRNTEEGDRIAPAKIRPTKAGKRVLRRRGKLRARVRITYKPTGGTARSKTIRVTLKLKWKRRR